MLVGGGPIPPSVRRGFVQLAGGAGRARIAVFPLASSVATTGPSTAAEFASFGARTFVIDVSLATANSDSLARMLDSATGIWFAGGDQNRITRALAGSSLERAIRTRFAAGAVVGGTSAGAAAMGDLMITGDERRLGGDRPPADSSQGFLTIDRDNIITSRGFGLVRGAIIDQHFVRRKRHNRLISLVLENPRMLGIGIDESTALVVRSDGLFEVIGSSVVVVLDARFGQVTNQGMAFGGSDIRMHVLPSGSILDPLSGAALLPRRR